MNGAEPGKAITGMLEDARAVPIHRTDPQTPLRVCVLLRLTPDPVEGSFYLLRDLPDARVYLGCVLDAGGRVREWLEISLQNIDGLAGALSGCREHLDNAFLDQRWTRHCETMRDLAPDSFLQTGWEAQHPQPSFIDPASASLFHPGNSGETFELCRDDVLLQAAGLPAYSTSLYRYLYQPSLAKESRFVPVVAEAPENSMTRPMATMLGDCPQATPWNAQGGLMMVTKLHPLGAQDYLDLLGGKPWEGVAPGQKPLRLGISYQSLEAKERSQYLGSHLFLAAHGRAGRFLECFHLKLQFLAEATGLVHAYVQKNQRPLLNLTPDSFRVKLGELDQGLPLLWTARCALAKPGQAHALRVKTTAQRYFIRIGIPSPSIYQPVELGLPVRGFGTVRIRKVLPPERDGVVLEGTLVMPEPQPVSPRDLLCIHLPVLAGRIDLYGNAYAAEGLARGEIRFRTLPQKLSEATVVVLKTAEGVPYSRCAFEVVPMLSSPCDLYALGVLAVRALLVHDKNTLAVALDEILSLARQASLEFKPDVPLPGRIRTLFESDPRWMASLGPHRLTNEEITPEEAGRLMPSTLWMEALAAIVRLFPGIGPDSICRDLGDAPALALETIFTQPLAAWNNILLRSRSLIVIDWNFNREIHEVIDKFRI